MHFEKDNAAEAKDVPLDTKQLFSVVVQASLLIDSDVRLYYLLCKILLIKVTTSLQDCNNLMLLCYTNCFYQS
jgi:hypothetical protein